MPTPPPIFDKADVEVYWSDENGKISPIGEAITDVVIHSRKGDQFIFTYECLSVLLDNLETIVTNIEIQKTMLNKEDRYYDNKLEALKRKIEKIEHFKAGSQIWQGMLEDPTDFPKVGTVKCLEVGLLDAYSDLKVEEVKTKTLVVLNIKK